MTTAGLAAGVLAAGVLAMADAPGASHAPIMPTERGTTGTVQRATPDKGCLCV